ncbi:uncharacterized protein [Halyomorpha halys]|uniref:uncharacterized protein n=1 Tax=Halyomorpha halys TaxID=286706 RepID=UPI0006D50254|nr:uncharacterized protein LOC106691057 [Halyomorpha halys]
MIGTFWNLCRACPSMPVDKLHSEYRSTYRWHEYTGPRQEVVRKPPQPLSGNKEEEENKNVENIIAPPTSGGNIEPALPRRKKNPSLAYRTHDLLTSKRDKENHTSTSLDRARHRGWGTELVPEHIAELYNKQITLWEQVSRRSSLSALSLASSTHRSITKEEKEKENNKKSSPTNAFWPENVIKYSQKIEKSDEIKKDFPPRSRIDHFVRHHLERTTGVGEEGILHSPTREKLEPALIRRKDTGNESTRSPQKVQSYTGRSQSAGPNTSSVESRSPKRTPRLSHGTKHSAPDKKQRPTTLDTAPSRTIQKTGSNKGVNLKNKSGGIRVKPNSKASHSISKDKLGDEVETSEAEIPEPVVKSPPEPTRVKSPEQVLMRSPEPVNWTVPLDTGKTFTVTQNVSEAVPEAKLYKGEGLCRPQSESKMRSESIEPPPPPPQSAPPAFTDESDWKKDDSEKKKNYEKPVPGTTLRCLDDPSFTFESSSHDPKSSSDVIEKAHSRFDHFWGKTNQENEESQGQI